MQGIIHLLDDMCCFEGRYKENSLGWGVGIKRETIDLEGYLRKCSYSIDDDGAKDFSGKCCKNIDGNGSYYWCPACLDYFERRNSMFRHFLYLRRNLRKSTYYPQLSLDRHLK